MCSPASFDTRLPDGADRRHLAFLDPERVRAEHLARREVDEPLECRRRRDRRLEGVVGADHVHAHRSHRALQHRVHAGDRRAVDEMRRAVGRQPQRVGIEDISLHELEVRMLREDEPRERVAMQVVERDDAIAVDQLARERRAYETRAAGDEDPLAFERHAATVTPRLVSSAIAPE
jgi:hypothetical protein